MSNKPNMLINLPPPPSDPTTPYEQGPGTPNSTTTSLSALSVVAIKDGAAGHNPNSHLSSRNQPTQTLEAERADRISRLAGLERVATVRSTPSGNIVPGVGPHHGQGGMHKEISTVGTASATGSVGGKTTWASESMDYDADKMSEDTTDTAPDQDVDDGADTSSIGGMSDGDRVSLVGFGEGASSTVSGPINTAQARAMAARHAANNPYIVGQSPLTPRSQQFGVQPTGQGSGISTPMSGIDRPLSGTAAAGSTDPKMMDGISFDQQVIDTTVSTPPPASASSLQTPQQGRFSGIGTDIAENITRGRIDAQGGRALDTPPNQQNLGSFGFEKD